MAKAKYGQSPNMLNKKDTGVFLTLCFHYLNMQRSPVGMP